MNNSEFKKIRLKLRLTQERFGSLFGLDRFSIIRIEQGKQKCFDCIEALKMNVFRGEISKEFLNKLGEL